MSTTTTTPAANGVETFFSTLWTNVKTLLVAGWSKPNRLIALTYLGAGLLVGHFVL